LQKEKVRVYALARELNVESKDLLDLCRQAGIDVKNQLSSLDPDQRDLVEQLVKKGGGGAATAVAAPPKPAAPVIPQVHRPVRNLSGRPSAREPEVVRATTAAPKAPEEAPLAPPPTAPAPTAPPAAAPQAPAAAAKLTEPPATKPPEAPAARPMETSAPAPAARPAETPAARVPEVGKSASLGGGGSGRVPDLGQGRSEARPQPACGPPTSDGPRGHAPASEAAARADAQEAPRARRAKTDHAPAQ